MANIADKIYGLIENAVKDCNVELWDVRYLKEGASWYLRIYIDKPDGISIDDCTNVSHAIDPILDSEDPIDDSYYMEVCSPGIERELVKKEHFIKSIGKKAKIKLYKTVDGIKEFTGILVSCADSVHLQVENIEYEFNYKDISKANLSDFEN